MTVEEFITQVFLGDCKRLVDCGFHFFSFSTIGFGIEFLGACLDAHPFDKRDQSTVRFNTAMKKLFPPKYRGITQELRDDLRNGFARQFRPGRRLELTHREESIRLDRPHLARRKGKICLVAEELYSDFQQACKEAIEMRRSGLLTHAKFKKAYLNAP